MAYIPTPTTVYDDPTGKGEMINASTAEDASVDIKELKKTVGIEAWVHTNPGSTQIDINQVADQLSHDPQRPDFKVTVDQLKKGGRIDYAFGRKLTDARGGGGGGGHIDPSTWTSDDPSSWLYDADKDGKPDFMQWKTI